MNRGAAFYRNVVRLALPILLQNLCTTLLGLIDTFMVGALGEAPLAAVLVANIPVFVIQLVIFGLQSGSSVLISQFWGKGDTESINRVIGLGCYVAGAISLAFASGRKNMTEAKACSPTTRSWYPWRPSTPASWASPIFSTASPACTWAPTAPWRTPSWA